jgi:hypothetical protein
MNLWTVTRVGALALVIAAPLSACGKQGQLDRPGPLFGKANAASVKDTDKATRDAQKPSAVDTVDPRDRSLDPAPPRTLPIQGTSSDAFKQPPPGALPNPFANPR